jgi:hypothetical protein
MHEIHRPHLVQRPRHRQRLGLLAHHALLWPDPQVQFEVPIDVTCSAIFGPIET